MKDHKKDWSYYSIVAVASKCPCFYSQNTYNHQSLIVGQYVACNMFVLKLSIQIVIPIPLHNRLHRLPFCLPCITNNQSYLRHFTQINKSHDLYLFENRDKYKRSFQLLQKCSINR